MTKRLLLVLPALILVSVFVLQSHDVARARTVPNGINCTPQCESWQVWNFASTDNKQGASTNTTLDDPNCCNFAAYEKFLMITWHNGSQAAVGELKHAGQCNGLGLYYELYDAVTNSYTDSPCYSVNTNDINHQFTVAADRWNNSNEMDVWINSLNTGDNKCTPCKFFNGNDFGGAVQYIGYYVLIVDPNINGHVVWGGKWVNNEYLVGTGWHFQTGDGTQEVDITGQPEIFWQAPPSVFGSNAALYSCVYDSSVTCSLGS